MVIAIFTYHRNVQESENSILVPFVVVNSLGLTLYASFSMYLANQESKNK